MELQQLKHRSATWIKGGLRPLCTHSGCLGQFRKLQTDLIFPVRCHILPSLFLKKEDFRALFKNILNVKQ